MGLVSRALGALLLAMFCTQLVLAGQGRGSLHRLEEAGIQFTVPAGWDVKAEKDGLKVVPKGTHNAQVAFIPLPIPTDMSPEQKEDLFNSVSEKSGINEQILGEYKGHESLNGIPVSARAFEGKNNGHDVEGVYYLLSADKLVFIVLVADKSLSDDLGNQAAAIIKSITRIE